MWFRQFWGDPDPTTKPKTAGVPGLPEQPDDGIEFDVFIDDGIAASSTDSESNRPT
jgi:hypothetical protein